MSILIELVIAFFVLAGAFFLFVGSFGLLKLDDLMRRLHAPTKAATLGIGSLLIASMGYFWYLRGTPSFHELLITIFLFLAAPVTALVVAKANLLREKGLRENLPPTTTDRGWATFDSPSASGDESTSDPLGRG